MSNYHPEAAAAELRRIRLARQILMPLDPAIAPGSETEGAAVQRALARLVGAEQPAGFKIGATGKRMQVYLGLTGPAAGFMEVRNVHRASADLRYADFVRPGVECEVAVRLAHDLLPGDYTAAQAAAAVGEFVAAIEVVENRYEDLKALGTPTLIADQVYHGAAVVGTQGGVDWRRLQLAGLRGRIAVDGAVRDEGLTSELLDDPLNGLSWLAGSPVAAAFGGLKAGQVVMLGSVTPPVWLDGPGEIMVEFPPLPPVRVRLT